MNNPGQTHWANCATEGGPAHYECAVREVERLRTEIDAISAAMGLGERTEPWDWDSTTLGEQLSRIHFEITRLRADHKWARGEIAALQHDVERHVKAASEYADECERLRTLTTPQPIETAPKDGRCILLHNSDEPMWIEGWWSTTRETWANAYKPTHWVPLPEAPK